MDRPQSPFLRFLLEASVHLDGARDVDKAMRGALRITREAFEADEVCFATPRFGEKRFHIYASQPTQASWEKEAFRDFMAGRRPRLGATRLYAMIERRGRPWGVLALRNRERRFKKFFLKDIARVGTSLSRTIERLDRARIAEVRARVDRKMMEQLRPLDLFYQVLHGLRTLTHYDHSAAVLIQPAEESSFEVVAEQISWRKGPSERIGKSVTLGEEARRLLERGEIVGLDRKRGDWRAWSARPEATELVALIDKAESEEQRAMSLLVAPFVTRDENHGALVVAARVPGSLGPYEADLVRRFLPVAAVAIRNLEWATSLEASVLEAESRNALATLARGVSHDVNNALGAILPRVQQMEEELGMNQFEPELFQEDLADIRAGLQVCRRIFGGLLTYARNSAVAGQVGSLKQAVDGMCAVLCERMEARGIQVDFEGLEGLPTVRCTQADLDQLVLNLSDNALDAMPQGGRLQLVARLEEGELRFTILDTGIGIPSEHLPRVKEAFFTTKKHGNGLGLSICRAILWRMGGKLKLDSNLGRGTRVELTLPIVEASVPAERQQMESETQS